MLRLEVDLTFTNTMLGTKPKNVQLFEDYVAKLAPTADLTAEEMETAREMEAEIKERSGTTIFHRKNGKIFINDFMIRGFFKEKLTVLKMIPDSSAEYLGTPRGKIDSLVFVTPREIFLNLPEGTDVGILERPLRVDTMKGPRVSLARSETVPEGTTCKFTIEALSPRVRGKDKHILEWKPLLIEALDIGKWNGIGQWRNSGAGSFVYTVKDVSDS